MKCQLCGKEIKVLPCEKCWLRSCLSFLKENGGLVLNCKSCNKREFKDGKWMCTEDKIAIDIDNIHSGRFCTKHSFLEEELENDNN